MSKRSRRVRPRKTPAAAVAPWRPDAALIGITLLALVVRLAVVFDTRDLPLYRTPQLDSLELVTWAKQILLGDYVWPSPPTHGATYPYVLAAFLRLTGESLAGARMFQAVLGALSVFVTMRLARRWFDRSTAMAAGVLLALYGPLVFVETSFYEEGVFTLLLVASLLFTSGAANSRAGQAAAGACLGLAAAARPTGLVLLPLYAFAISRRPAPRSLRLRLATVLVATCMAALTPVVWKNWAATGVPMVRAFGGLNFFMGNRPGSDGVAEARIGEGWDRLQAAPLALGITSPVEQDRYFVRRAMDDIGRDPVGWLATVAKKALWLTQATEIRESHSFHFFASQSAFLRMLPNFAILFPLAAAGLFIAARDRRVPLLLGGYLLLIALTCIGLVVGLRYRIPLVPVLVIFGGHGLNSIVADVRGRSWRRVAAAAAVLIAAVVLALARPHAPSLNFAEEWAFTGDALLNERRPETALDAYRRSIDADPGRALGWDGVGLAHLNLGQLAEAETAVRTALSLEPGWAAAHHHMGLILLRRGDLDGAVAEFKEAARIRPDDGEIASDLADALLANGDADAAVAVYREIERRTRPSAALYAAIARAEGMAGRPQQALDAATRSVALDPTDGEAWLLLSLSQRATRDLGAAEQSLQRAATLLGEQEEVQLVRAMLRRAQGRHTEAVAIVRQVLESNPASEHARELLLQYTGR